MRTGCTVALNLSEDFKAMTRPARQIALAPSKAKAAISGLDMFAAPCAIIILAVDMLLKMEGVQDDSHGYCASNPSDPEASLIYFQVIAPGAVILLCVIKVIIRLTVILFTSLDRVSISRVFVTEAIDS